MPQRSSPSPSPSLGSPATNRSTVLGRAVGLGAVGMVGAAAVAIDGGQLVVTPRSGWQGFEVITEGGAVVVDDGQLVMVSCLVNGNRTHDLPAVVGINGAVMGLVNLTVTHNDGDAAFGGIGSFDQTNLLLGNSIVWDNSADAPQSAARVQLAVDNGVLTQCVHSIVQDVDLSIFDLAQMVGEFDPRFVDAAGDDGITGTDDDDLRLSEHSCLIDQGFATLFDPALFAVDVAGDPRRVDDLGTADGDQAGIPAIDAGAFEFAGRGCRTDLDDSGATDFGDLLQVLSTWGLCEACPSDLNCNGVVDFGDLLEVLSRWGDCSAG